MTRIVPALVLLAAPAWLAAAVEEGTPPPLPTSSDEAAPPAAGAPAAPPRLVRANGPGEAAAQREEVPSRFGASLTVAAGYDSNIVLADNQHLLGIDTGKDGAAVDVDAKGVWRAIDRADTRLSVVVSGELDEYARHSDRDLLRYGALVTGITKWNGWDPGFAVGAHQYRLDGDRAAEVADASVGMSRIARDWVAIPSLEAYAVNYADLDDADGVLYAARYRHWFLLAPGDSRKRLEAGVRVGWYDAKTDAWSYATVRPEVGAAYRIGSRPQRGTIDLAARAFWEYRDYDQPAGAELDHEQLWDASAGADWWTCRYSAIGLYTEYTVRQSDEGDRDYHRLQIGARLTAAW